MIPQRTIIIGTGAIAQEHILAFKDKSWGKIEAVCDISSARVRSTGQRYQIGRVFTDHRKMISEVPADWAHITTPPSTHVELARDCLRAGLNVICEKPITNGPVAFRELRELAEERGLHLLENQNLRFHSTVARLRNMVQSGDVGEISEVQILLSNNIYAAGSPYTDRNVRHFSLNLPGGVIGDFLPHMAYLAESFCGPLQVSGTVWQKRIASSPIPYDEFRGLLRGDGAHAYLAFSSLAQPDGFWLRIWGSKLYAEANLFEPPKLQVRRNMSQPPPLPSLLNGMREATAIAGGSINSVWRKLGGKSQYDGLAEFIEAAYRARKVGDSQIVSMDEIEANVKLVEDLTKEEGSR